MARLHDEETAADDVDISAPTNAPAPPSTRPAPAAAAAVAPTPSPPTTQSSSAPLQPPPAPPAHIVLPDDVVLRIIRFTLESSATTGGAGALGGGGSGDAGKWSVGGCFRMAMKNSRSNNNINNNNNNSGFAAAHAVPRRGPLREVCRQWRRLLDGHCAHLEVRQAVVFGDEELVGLAGVLGRGGGGCTRLTLEGSHMVRCCRLNPGLKALGFSS